MAGLNKSIKVQTLPHFMTMQKMILMMSRKMYKQELWRESAAAAEVGIAPEITHQESADQLKKMWFYC